MKYNFDTVLRESEKKKRQDKILNICLILLAIALIVLLLIWKEWWNWLHKKSYQEVKSG